MHQKRNSGPSLPIATAISLLVAAATVGMLYVMTGRRTSGAPAEKYALAHVQRTDLYPALTTGGQVQSSKRDVIECELREHRNWRPG